MDYGRRWPLNVALTALPGCVNCRIAKFTVGKGKGLDNTWMSVKCRGSMHAGAYAATQVRGRQRRRGHVRIVDSLMCFSSCIAAMRTSAAMGARSSVAAWVNCALPRC